MMKYRYVHRIHVLDKLIKVVYVQAIRMMYDMLMLKLKQA